MTEDLSAKALDAAIAEAASKPSWATGITRTAEEKVFAVARWAAAIQREEDSGNPDRALEIVALGPQMFLPPRGELVNATTMLGLAFVFGGTQYAEVYEGEDGKHYFRVKAGNHEIIDGSQGYATEGNARRALNKRYPGITIKGDDK